MRKYSTLRWFLRMIPALLAWTAFMLILWGFVYLRLTDTLAEQKLVLYIDGQVLNARDMMLELESKTVENASKESVFGQDADIRMIKIRPLTYNILGYSAENEADLFIVAEPDMEKLLDWFLPLPEELSALGSCYLKDGTAYGVEIDISRYLENAYVNQSAPETNYLCLCKNTVHAGDVDTAVPGFFAWLIGENNKTFEEVP